MSAQLQLIKTAPEQDYGYIFDNMDIKNETKEEYKYRLKVFLDWLGARDLHKNILLEYKTYLNNQYNSVSSKNKYFIAAKIYLRELRRNNEISGDYTSGVKGFKSIGKHKKFGQSQDEVKSIIKNLDYFPVRDRLLMLFFIYQGFRQVEMIRLSAEDVNFAQGTILVHGKGRDDKEIVHLHPKVSKLLREYIVPGLNDTGRLFPITDRQMRNIFGNICKTLNIDNTSLHGLRHHFVTKLIDAFDGNLAEVRKYTRHENLEMLIVYNDELSKEKTLDKFYGAFENL